MGIVFTDDNGRLVIQSVIYTYGDAATEELTAKIANDIAVYWNGPHFTIGEYKMHFEISGIYEPNLAPEEVWQNDDATKNFFRIEEYCELDVSFVDGIGSNTGYLKLANLLHTGSTIAHEYGHSLGLKHPDNLDIRGQGEPGIMYPRGTITDAIFQYNPAAPAGEGPLGGTMDAAKRMVTTADIKALRLDKYRLKKGEAKRVGDFTSIFHYKHIK